MKELGKYTPAGKPNVEWYQIAPGGVSMGGINWQDRYDVKIPFANREVAYEVLGRVEEMLQALIKQEGQS